MINNTIPAELIFKAYEVPSSPLPIVQEGTEPWKLSTDSTIKSKKINVAGTFRIISSLEDYLKEKPNDQEIIKKTQAIAKQIYDESRKAPVIKRVILDFIYRFVHLIRYGKFATTAELALKILNKKDAPQTVKLAVQQLKSTLSQPLLEPSRELLPEVPAEGVPIGLPNLQATTCWMNAMLQFFAGSSCFDKWFITPLSPPKERDMELCREIQKSLFNIVRLLRLGKRSLSGNEECDDLTPLLQLFLYQLQKLQGAPITTEPVYEQDDVETHYLNLYRLLHTPEDIFCDYYPDVPKHSFRSELTQYCSVKSIWGDPINTSDLIKTKLNIPENREFPDHYLFHLPYTTEETSKIFNDTTLSENMAKYIAVAGILYSGNGMFGHYVTYVRTRNGVKKYSDGTVTLLKEEPDWSLSSLLLMKRFPPSRDT